MKRYFIAPVEAKDYIYSNYTYFHLPDTDPDSDGFIVIVLESEDATPRSEWVELPHLLDQKKTMDGGGHYIKLKSLGIDKSDTTLDTALKLGKIHPKFKP